MPIIRLDTRRITSWDTFHDVFAEAFGFPDFYGRNMNAWIDCMTSLDAPEDGMTSILAPPGEVVTIQLDDGEGFARRCPEQYDALVKAASFVNSRRIETGDRAVLALDTNP